MLKKEFKRKDVERMRNLIKGDTDSSTEIQIGYTKKKEDHKEGDIWEEQNKTWTIKNGMKAPSLNTFILHKPSLLISG